MTRFVGISDETQINSKDVITIKLPTTGTFYQGDQLIAEKLITGSRTNYEGADCAGRGPHGDSEWLVLWLSLRGEQILQHGAERKRQAGAQGG